MIGLHNNCQLSILLDGTKTAWSIGLNPPEGFSHLGGARQLARPEQNPSRHELCDGWTVDDGWPEEIPAVDPRRTYIAVKPHQYTFRQVYLLWS